MSPVHRISISMASFGSGLVKNLYIDTKIMTLGGFLDKLESFFYIFHRLGGHFGSHFGGHLGFTGHLYI